MRGWLVELAGVANVLTVIRKVAVVIGNSCRSVAVVLTVVHAEISTSVPIRRLPLLRGVVFVRRYELVRSSLVIVRRMCSFARRTPIMRRVGTVPPKVIVGPHSMVPPKVIVGRNRMVPPNVAARLICAVPPSIVAQWRTIGVLPGVVLVRSISAAHRGIVRCRNTSQCRRRRRRWDSAHATRAVRVL